MSVLPNGEYTIINKATELIVGRNVFEDKSGLPKGIFTLDPSVGTEDGRRWTIVNVEEGRSVLRAGGAPVGERERLLYAFINNDIADAGIGEWIIEKVPQEGEDCYIIVNPTDRLIGWVAHSEEAKDKQIEVRELISTKSLPPRYPHHQVFVIRPIGY
ncbi:hypothetical protein PHLGIDRAFT_448464 [Phlebiopsis gigantea 11061_1 CR5-6]|uniref:Uncharacterized protein n=1 Tax=Phlebiopsis gigantea (strain 11061_1 CR5-6) TaxID=745531 RepID=A0A0C3S7C1_PHLG1|nr:hypothetical protein PHLGIDRAFT_448464 [Phlebiopsis gigantea 11061_1 CR5-6]